MKGCSACEGDYEQQLDKERGEPNALWWLSFVDPDGEEGQRFLGVVMVEAPGFLHAVLRTKRLGVNPGGEVKGMPLSLEALNKVPAAHLDVLLSKTQLQEGGYI